jgi:hypothetical protein
MAARPCRLLRKRAPRQMQPAASAQRSVLTPGCAVRPPHIRPPSSPLSPLYLPPPCAHIKAAADTASLNVRALANSLRSPSQSSITCTAPFAGMNTQATLSQNAPQGSQCSLVTGELGPWAGAAQDASTRRAQPGRAPGAARPAAGGTGPLPPPHAGSASRSAPTLFSTACKQARAHCACRCCTLSRAFIYGSAATAATPACCWFLHAPHAQPASNTPTHTPWPLATAPAALPHFPPPGPLTPQPVQAWRPSLPICRARAAPSHSAAAAAPPRHRARSTADSTAWRPLRPSGSAQTPWAAAASEGAGGGGGAEGPTQGG